MSRPPGPGSSAARGSSAKRLGLPVPARVHHAVGGKPRSIDGHAVDAVRESWLIEDRWWTDRPLRRRYWEVVTQDGRDLIVFRDLLDGRWYRQR